MKLLILLLVVSVLSCTKMKYHDKFISYSDSIGLYSDKFNCYLNCNNDSLHYALKMENQFNDSATKYYSLLHPNGNSIDIKKEKVSNCNCK